MSTNFEKVGIFNESFQLNRHSCIDNKIFNKDPELIKFRLSLIEEEFKELLQACKDKDMTETRDALADILYVVYGMQDALGINGNRDFELVHNSNMSKICTSEEEAIQTVESYKKKYENGTSPYDSPYYHKVNEHTYLVKNKSTGKALKSINYKPVILL